MGNSDGSILIDTKLNQEGLKSGLSKIGSLAGTALKGVGVAIGTVSTAFAGLVTASVKARGELEQQIGGVETLFKDSADKVIKNANNAYKTAGMSAIEYMQNVTSFSASLLQSTAGDTAKAADIADMAMVDMSDNANKMGTSMEAIQNAYQGFAKQNYTMLDNLKLGYGGTKTEMERLLKDAQKLTGVKYDINNLSDVYNAIHAIQKKLEISGYSTDELKEKLQSMTLTKDELTKVAESMGISYDEAFQKMKDGTLSVIDAQTLLGTTAKEATSTLQGSMKALSASWQNFLSGSGDLGQVVDSLEIAFENILRITNEAIPSIISNITSSLPKLIELGGKMLNNIIDGIITNLPILMESAGQILSSLIQAIITYLPQLITIGMQVINMLINGIISYLPQLMESAGQILNNLAQGIINVLPQLFPVALQTIQTLITGLISYLPQIIQMGVQILCELANGIAQMLPTLIPLAVDCIITIVDSLLDNIDQLIDAGIELIFALADGLIEALPKLIEKAPIIIQKLVDAFIRNFPKVVQAGGELIGKLAMGILGSLAKLAEVAPKLIRTIVDGLKRGFGEIKNAGNYLVEGLWNGIQGMAGWVSQKVQEFASNIVKNLKNALGIHSPSKVFRDEIGKYMALGVGEGFTDNIKNVYKQMKTAVDFETQRLNTNLTANSIISMQRDINVQSRLQSIDDNKEIVVNSTTKLDSRVIARETNKVNARRKLQYGLA